MTSPSLKSRIDRLYTGRHATAVRFRYALLVFDLVTVAYFIATTPYATSPTHHAVHFGLAVVIFLDLAARFWIEPSRLHYLTRIYVLADIVVLASLVLSPFVAVNLAFLRILRGLRLGHSKYLLRDLRRDWRLFREHEDAMVACLNLIVFVFVTAAGVFTFFVGVGAGMSGYLDAIYFTVTTLTTTGYGDITPSTWQGKLVSIGIMIVGVSLFLNLARAIFTPGKVHHPCRGCGLTRHEPDAIHCKHCGAEVQIETRGFS
ncbi:potassium channel family protein [Tropicimonas sp. S265A]|uniref:potassium channel family protein n=1 Tax=Tropicimonas sp. S265A TaxID=3415134 RepID=UPI003C7E3B04